ncbi:hypothetical protein E2I20_27915 [Alcaligenaceae bacterium SAGV3]|nr:hypothetical protein [Alcaligenaceae bacterium SAGV3]
MTGAAILTAGVHSTGILAQSVGGGGGTGGSSSSAASAGGTSDSWSLGASLGGKSGGGGVGGAVVVKANVMVQTLGDLSIAVLAQSVGGGGGPRPVRPFRPAGSLPGQPAAGLAPALRIA